MENDFSELSTVLFQQKLKPAALKIYQGLFPGCEVKDLREKGVEVHILDKEFGIDSLIGFKSGQWISLQEKYRNYSSLKWGDFTQEYKNAEGTSYESFGEWFKLGAQLYFYGWANQENTDFLKWFILDIPAYKIIIEKLGGIEKAGIKKQNNRYGKASFYGISLQTLYPAMMFKHNINLT